MQQRGGVELCVWKKHKRLCRCLSGQWQDICTGESGFGTHLYSWTALTSSLWKGRLCSSSVRLSTIVSYCLVSSRYAMSHGALGRFWGRAWEWDRHICSLRGCYLMGASKV